MSGKRAKKLRKEVRKEAERIAREQENMPTIPLAGCPSCGEKKWLIRLDQPPPHHTWIVSIICSNKDCHQEVLINLNIREHGRAMEEPKVIGEELCSECGFELDDCQCPRMDK